MATVQADGEKIRQLRLSRAWPQEQLAAVADVSPRTIQRIENGGKASFETLRAIATAFGVDVNDLIRKPEQPKPAPRPAPPPIFLVRVTSGKILFNSLGGAHAGHFDHDELRSHEEVEMVGSFLQDMRDYLDIWDDIEPGERTRVTFAYTERIEELEQLGLWVFAARQRRKVRIGAEVTDWDVSIIMVMHSDDPTIIRVPPDKESVPATSQG